MGDSIYEEDSVCEKENLVICLYKALELDVSKEKLPQPPCASLGGPWVTLGYFDAMDVYPLIENASKKEKDWPQAIWEHNLSQSQKKQDGYYVHPFHVMASIKEQSREEEYRVFWKLPADCFFVTLVQGIKEYPDEEREKSRKAFPYFLEEKLEGALAKKDDAVSYVFYHTLELSDVVILWKANTMREILVRIQELSEEPFVGELSTFCGLSFDALERSQTNSNTYEIPHVTMRLAARNMAACNDFFSALANTMPSLSITPFFVTGTEDFHIDLNDITESDFFKILYKCFLDKDISAKFRNAFQEVETQIGIHLSLTVGNATQPVLSPFTQQCRALFDQFKNLYSSCEILENMSSYSWMKPALGQLNELQDMSKSCMVDGLCYLVIDAVKLFCKEVDCLLKSKKPLTSNQIKGLQRFVRGWGILVEQAGRTDGRFAQLPGFSSPLYDIPSTLLEFYLAFTKRCVTILQDGESDDREYALLLVPKLCRRIKVEIVIADRNPPCDRLLYVDIPLDMLYDPFAILCQLSHEISHFCGGTTRQRKKRSECFLFVCAYELSVTLNMDTPQIVRWLYNKFDSACYSATEEAYFSHLERDALDYIKMLLSDDAEFGQLMKYAENHLEFQGGWERYSWRSDCIAIREILNNSWANDRGRFPVYIGQIRELFSECYADISMIQLLDLKAEEYLKLAKNELRLFENRLLQINTQKPTLEQQVDINGYYMMVQRWALVMCAAFPYSPDISLKGDLLQRFYEDIHKCTEYMNYPETGQKEKEEEEENPLLSSFLNISTLRAIRDYLRSCIKKINKEFSKDKSKKLNDLQQAFQSMARDHKIEYDACSALITEYEKMFWE